MDANNHIHISYRIPILSELLVKETQLNGGYIIMACRCRKQSTPYCAECGTKTSIKQEIYYEHQLSELGIKLINSNLKITTEDIIDVSKNDIIGNYRTVPYYYICLEEYEINAIDVCISIGYQEKIRDTVIQEIQQFNIFSDEELYELKNKFEIKIKFSQTY
jgi:hypothetical protein